MFERFTERARHVVVCAQEEARTLGHDWIGTEHLLLGLCSEEGGVAAAALEELEVGPLDEVRERVVQAIGSHDRVGSGRQIPFTPRAKKVLELSLREALSINHNYIGTEHLLLALARESEGVAASVLRGFGAGPDEICNEVLRIMTTAEYARIHQHESARAALAEGMPVPPAPLPAPPPSLGRVLQRAAAEAQKRPVRTFDTGDVLLSLAIDADTVAGRALASLAVDVEALRVAVDKTRESS